VLAAVVIFGLTFTMLSRIAMQGLAAEGEASRRLRASLLADQMLGDLEAQLAIGEPPPQGVTEDEGDEFSTEVEVRPYDLAILLAGAEVPDYITEGTRGQRPLPILEPPRNGAPALLQLDVRIRWLEGVFEREVTRSTFGIDAAALEPLIASLVEQQEGERNAEDDADEDSEGEDEPARTPAPVPTPERDESPFGEDAP
jgi:hypothetical protein